MKKLLNEIVIKILSVLYSIAKLALYIGIGYLIIIVFSLFVFSSSDTEIDYEVPQNIGGVLIIKGTETDYYEGCTYNINLSYQSSESEDINFIGELSGNTRVRDICNQMGFYSPRSIYTDMQIKKINDSYYLLFKNGGKPYKSFKSDNLKDW